MVLPWEAARPKDDALCLLRADGDGALFLFSRKPVKVRSMSRADGEAGLPPSIGRRRPVLSHRSDVTIGRGRVALKLRAAGDGARGDDEIVNMGRQSILPSRRRCTLPNRGEWT